MNVYCMAANHTKKIEASKASILITLRKERDSCEPPHAAAGTVLKQKI